MTTKQKRDLAAKLTRLLLLGYTNVNHIIYLAHYDEETYTTGIVKWLVQ